MSEPAWWAEARRLYAEYGTYAEVGRQLGRSADSVRHALNPAARVAKVAYKRDCWRQDPTNRERDRVKARRWKDEHREQNRARDRARLDALAAGRCSCGNRIFDGASAPCGECRVKERAETRRRVIHSMWHEGASINDIAERLDSTSNSIGCEIHFMRGQGWDMPYRRVNASPRFPKQVAA